MDVSGWPSPNCWAERPQSARRARIVVATPARMALPASTRRIERVSPRHTTAPRAAITGTVNCTLAACNGRRCGKARYIGHVQRSAWPDPDGGQGHRDTEQGGAQKIPRRIGHRRCAAASTQGVEPPGDARDDHHRRTERIWGVQTGQHQPAKGDGGHGKPEEFKKVGPMSGSNAQADHAHLHRRKQQNRTEGGTQAQISQGEAEGISQQTPPREQIAPANPRT